MAPSPLLPRYQAAATSLNGMVVGMPFATSLHSLWVDGVLPLAHDNEQSVQQRCAELVREAVADRVISWHESDADHAEDGECDGEGVDDGGGSAQIEYAANE